MNRRIGAVFSYVYMMLEVVSTLLLTPIIIKTLGDAEYGVYKLVVSVSVYLLLLDMGMGNSVIRYAAKYKETNDIESSQKFIGVCVLFYSVIVAVVLILGTGLISNFQHIFSTGLSGSEIELGKKLLAITILNAAVTLGTSVWYNIIIAYSQFAISKGVSIMQIILRIILNIVALKLGMRSVAIVTINFFLTVVARGFYCAYVVFSMKLKPKFKGLDLRFVKDIVAYSAFILLQMVATQINAYADQVMLGMLVLSSSALIAIYGVGSQLVQYFQSIGQALGGVLMPGVVKLVEGRAKPIELQNEMVRIGRYSFMLLGIIFVGFAVNGERFILLWVGDAYRQSYYIALLLMLAYMFILTESIGTQILWAKNKHQLQSVIKLAVVVINLALTIALIKWKPLEGATIGTFISLFLGDILCMNIVFKKHIGISLREYYAGLFKGILPCLLISGACGFLLELVNLPLMIGLVCNVGLMVVTYGISMWLFGFNQQEKNILKVLVGKLINRRRQ